MELMTPEGNITIKVGLQPSLSTDIWMWVKMKDRCGTTDVSLV